MTGRLLAWLARRQATIHRSDEVMRSAEQRLDRAAEIVEEQRRDGEQASVNFLFDRLTGKGGKAHG